MAFQITGKIERIGEVVSRQSKDGTKTFFNRELILDCTRFNPDTGEPYANFPKFDVTGNNCSELDHFKVGDRIIVDFALNGAKYEDQGELKYFTSVRAYKFTLVQQGYQQQGYSPTPQPTAQATIQQVPAQQPQPAQNPTPQPGVQQPRPQAQNPQTNGYGQQYPPQPYPQYPPQNDEPPF